MNFNFIKYKYYELIIDIRYFLFQCVLGILDFLFDVVLDFKLW